MDHDFSIVKVLDLDTSAITVDPPDTVSVEALRLFHLGSKLMVMGTHIRKREVLAGRRWIVADQTWRVFIAAIEANRLTNVRAGSCEHPRLFQEQERDASCPLEYGRLQTNFIPAAQARAGPTGHLDAMASWTGHNSHCPIPA